MELNFDSGFFAENRRKLRDAVGDDVPVVIAAHGLLQKSRDEAYSFRQESNFWYLTGIDEPDFVLVMDGGKDYLIAPERSEYLNTFYGKLDNDKIKETSGVGEVLEQTAGWRRLGPRLKKAKAVAALKPLPAYIEQVGFYTNPADRSLINKIRTCNDKLKLMDIRLDLARLRAVKTDGELRRIRRATDESIRLHEDLAKNMRQFKTERDVLDFIKIQSVERGLKLAYEPIAAAGKNAAILHYENDQDSLKPGQPLLVDAAYSYLGYCSDITRTYCAQPSKRYSQIHNAVVEVQSHAIGLLKPGITPRDYEQEVEKSMGTQLKKLGLIKSADEQSIDKYYPHKASHFLGLDAHDAGDPDQPLAPGMVLSCEPGIYAAEQSIGVRIEDVVLITDKGNEVLSAKLPKNTGLG
jgi:Xaa-Pro aminopeptidase